MKFVPINATVIETSDCGDLKGILRSFGSNSEFIEIEDEYEGKPSLIMCYWDRVLPDGMEVHLGYPVYDEDRGVDFGK